MTRRNCSFWRWGFAGRPRIHSRGFRNSFHRLKYNANFAAALCHVSGDINLPNCPVRSNFFFHTMGTDLAMRLRTLIELLAALILTFAALFAVSEKARASGMKLDNVYARATIVKAKNGVYLTLNDVGSETDRFGCTATGSAGIDSPHSDACREPFANWLNTQN
jgi:hypothetical protein